MNLFLIQDKKIELPNPLGYEDRKKFLNDNLLHNQNSLTDEQGREFTLEEYYNTRSKYIDNKEKQKMAIGRWLGSNYSSNLDDHLKETLDFVGHYLMSAKDISVKWKVHEFKKLKRESLNKEFDLESKSNLAKLEDEVLFSHIAYGKDMQQDVVFFSNVEYIKQLKKQQSSDIGDYVTKKLESIKAIEDSVQQHSTHYSKLVEREIFVKNQARLVLTELEEDESQAHKDQLDTYLERLRLLRHRKDEILDEVRTLISEYNSLTELEVNYH